MNKYNEIYYLIAPNYVDYKIYKVTPNDESGRRRYHYRKLEDGDKPIELNSCIDDINIDKFKSTVLFSTPSFIIQNDLKDIFENKIYGGKLYPTIINSKDNSLQRDDFLLLNIFEELDCWDREKSNYEQEDEDDSAHVYSYSLDSNILDKIDENDRLIFKMGACDMSPLIVHEKIKEQLEKRASNLKFYPLSSYELGDEY